MIAALSFFFPLLKGLLGDGIVERLLNHKRAMADSANELQKANIEADVKVIEHELSRRSMIKELQLAEMRHDRMWKPKYIVMMVYALYVTGRVSVLLFGLDDYGVAVKPLDPWLEWLGGLVFGYMFLGEKIERAVRGGR